MLAENLEQYSLRILGWELHLIGFGWSALIKTMDCRREFFFWPRPIEDFCIQSLSTEGTRLAHEMARAKRGFILFNADDRFTLLQNRRVAQENSDLIETCRVLSLCS